MRSRGVIGVLAVLVVILAGRAVTLAQKQAVPFTLPSKPADPRPEANRPKWREPSKVEVPALPMPSNEMNPPEPGQARQGVPPTPGVAEADDPMGAVDAFLRRNRQETDASIEALTREAETLRARLQKVEAALARWQTVSAALNSEAPQLADPTRDEPLLKAINPPEWPAKEPEANKPDMPVPTPKPVASPPPTLDPTAF